MKAVQINAYGGVEVIAINPDAQKPSLKNNQVLVENRAASINPIDWKVRAGYLKDMVPLQFPITLGGDFSGIITEIGVEVTDLKVGDEIYGQAPLLNGGSGSMAEYVAANAASSAKRPANIDFIESASLPLTGVSAVQALEDHMKLQSGQKILIHGGAGGIGSIAIQLAKALGAYVATTVGTDDLDYVKQLGADEIVNYKTEQFEEKLKDFDAVYDTVGGETTDTSFQVLKRGGIILSMLGQPKPELAEKYGVTAIGQMTEVTTERLNRFSQLIDSGKIKPHVDKMFGLDQAKEAFMYQEAQHPRGKVVLKIKE
ncbi:MAG TPA: NADP-dependent oxidoreductase [Candidatus Saccharimonadales bacterium]|nr:NADP-dependent oxidoreductase [Candidatus Saccharimonadales bacterium]